MHRAPPPSPARVSSSGVRTGRESWASGELTLDERWCEVRPLLATGDVTKFERGGVQKLVYIRCRCGRKGATIKCQGDQCTLFYHFSCGATAAPEHVYIFRGEYPSFCWRHAPQQQIQQLQVYISRHFLVPLTGNGPFCIISCRKPRAA